MFPHSQAELIRAKIKQEHLQLLPEDERDSVYHLQKLLDWQEDYGYIEWKEFKTWTQCSTCGDWSDEQCICYAR